LVYYASAKTDTKLSRSVAQGLADRLNEVLNRTVSDSRLSVRPIAGHDADAFELVRIVDAGRVPCELDGTAAHLFVRLVVVVEDGRCRTESYAYRLQSGPSTGSWLIRWEYRRDPPRADYPYPRAHVHVNGTFPDGESIGRQHIPAPRMPLELVIRYLISDRGVKPRTDDWEAVLEDS
jgi:hypothetical protein